MPNLKRGERRTEEGGEGGRREEGRCRRGMKGKAKDGPGVEEQCFVIVPRVSRFFDFSFIPFYLKN